MICFHDIKLISRLTTNYTHFEVWSFHNEAKNIVCNKINGNSAKKSTCYKVSMWINFERSVFLIPSWLNYRYKHAFNRLRSLKTEIEHLQHILEKSKVKLMKDFEMWWAEQTVMAQVGRGTLRNTDKLKNISLPHLYYVLVVLFCFPQVIVSTIYLVFVEYMYIIACFKFVLCQADKTCKINSRLNITRFTVSCNYSFEWIE